MNIFIIALMILFFILYINSISKIKKLEEELNKVNVDFKNFKSSNYNSRVNNPEVVFPYSNNKKSNTKKESKNSSHYPITQEDIVAFQLKKIDRQYLYPKRDLIDVTHFFYNKKVVITGTFYSFENRNEIAKLLWEVGADVDTGIGKNTEILIVGDEPGVSKMIQGEDLGLEFVTENEFLNYFGL